MTKFFSKTRGQKCDCLLGVKGSGFKKNQYLKILKARVLGEKIILKGRMVYILFHSVLILSNFWALTITSKSSKPLHTWLGPVFSHLALIVRNKWCMTEIKEEDIMLRYPRFLSSNLEYMKVEERKVLVSVVCGIKWKLTTRMIATEKNWK